MRTTTPVMLTALAGWQSRVFLVEMDLSTGFEYYALASVDIDWNGHEWKGIFRPVEINEIRETDSGEAVGVQLIFHNVEEAVVAAALLDNIRRRPVTVYVACLDNAGAVIDDPLVVFAGYGDAAQIIYKDSQASVSMSIESREALWSRTAGGRMTDEAHRARYSDDWFFSMVSQAVETNLAWPSKDYFR